MSGVLTVDFPQASSDPDGDLIQFIALLRRSVETALLARRALLSELLQARSDPATALDRAGRASSRCVRAFDDALLRLNRARVPAPAADAAFELRRWLEAHVEACDLLSRAALARDRNDLAQAVQCLASTQPHAHLFNAARERLVRQLVMGTASAN